MRNRSFRTTLSLLAILAWPATGQGQQGAPSGAADPQEEDPSKREERVLGGPEGVSRNLEGLEEPESTYTFETLQRWGAPWFDWKARMKEDHGLSLGFTYHVLYQHASDVVSADDDAWGQIFRFQGNWVALGRGTGSPGRLEWRVESRSDFGSPPSPSELGGATGAAALNSGFGYSPEFDLDLPVLNWTQGFNDQTAGVAVGRLAFDVYLDAFLFQTFSRGFLNRAFLLNPTMATTGIGALGGVGKGFVGDNVWVGGQIHDANAASGEFDLDTVSEGEWLKAVEIGWTPSIDRYKTDRIQLTWWHKDEREDAGVPDGQGWVVSASWEVAEGLIPFTRFGHSDGGAGVAAESAASLGLEYAVRPDQALSVGVGWADPAAPGLDDEYVIETSYRMQLSPNFSLMPDLQLLLDPASNPDEDQVWVFGVRGLLSI
jgi:porin